MGWKSSMDVCLKQCSGWGHAFLYAFHAHREEGLTPTSQSCLWLSEAGPQPSSRRSSELKSRA